MTRSSGRRPHIIGLFISAALVAAAPVQAQSFCAEVGRIVTALSKGEPSLENVSLVLPDHPEAEADCRVSLDLSGTSAVHCGWGFAYRAPEAQAAFEALLEGAHACMGGGVAVEVDQPVNHPDAYALYQLRGQGRTLGVSLKDKARLQQSFVFLRIMAAE